MPKRLQRASFTGFTSAEIRKINAANTPAEWKKAFDEAVAARAARKNMSWETNPLSSTQWIIGGVAVLGIAGLIYYFTTKTTTGSSSSSGSSTNAAPTSAIVQNGSQSIVIPKTGFTLSLPTGATWITGGTPGTSTPLFFAGTTFTPGSTTAPIPIQWSQGGTTYTTNLSITALA